VSLYSTIMKSFELMGTNPAKPSLNCSMPV
jgi:hypothetical protein